MYHQWKGGGAGEVDDTLMKYRTCSGRKSLVLMINLLEIANIGKAHYRLSGVYIVYSKNRSHKNFHTSIHGPNGQLYTNINGLVDCGLANPGAQARVHCDNKIQQICLIHILL